nr:putative disease resistance rpp8-like protein 4 [Quercus suber]
MTDEGALPILDQHHIGPCPQLKEVPSGIHHLKNLKQLRFDEMPTEFVLSLQPDEGFNFGKVKHIPSVTFCKIHPWESVPKPQAYKETPIKLFLKC